MSLGETAAEWAAVRWLDANGVRSRYREAGRGLPLVLVHGLGVSADYWFRNAAIVAAAGYRVLAPDLPGFGKTEGPAEGLDVPAQSAALHRWTTAAGIGPAVYLGHSLSCQTILQLAVDHPEAVLGLVLAAPTGDGAAAPRLARQAIGLARDVRREPIKLLMLVAQAYFRAGPLKVLRTWWMGARHDPLALLAAVAVPGLVVVGDRDPVVGIEFAERMAAGLADGRVVVIPDGSHAVIFDESEAFNSAVTGFLAEVALRHSHDDDGPVSAAPTSSP